MTIWLYRDYIALTLLLLLAQYYQTDLMYQREFIQQGEWWRWWSGHLTHSNSMHLLMNLSGLWMLALFRPPIRYSWQFWGLTGVLMTGISLLFWYLLPQLQWYVGLSGCLYGFFTLLGIYFLFVPSERWLGIGLLLVLSIKALMDINHLEGGDSSSLIGATVIYQAHLFGMGLACIIAVMIYCYQRYLCETGSHT